jgi:hypothetical protein
MGKWRDRIFFTSESVLPRLSDSVEEIELKLEARIRSNKRGNTRPSQPLTLALRVGITAFTLFPSHLRVLRFFLLKKALFLPRKVSNS